MIAEFERARQEFLTDIELEKSIRKIEQQEADKICNSMFVDVGQILNREGIKKGNIFRAVIASIGWAYQNYPNVLSPDEITRYWVRTKPTSLGEESSSKVRLIAYGGKTPFDSRRKFIYIVGATRAIELRKDYGITWYDLEWQSESLKRAKIGNITNIVEAKFFRSVLDQFKLV